MGEKKFSVGTVVITAIVTFLVSGLGGSAVSEWLSRPKPLQTMSGVGFVGTDRQFQVSEALIEAVGASVWIARYHKYESFERLNADHEKAERVKIQLERGIGLVEDWLRENERTFNPQTIQDLSKTPYMVADVVGGSLIGMARRGEIERAPETLNDLERRTPITELAKLETGYLLYMGTYAVAFPLEGARTD